MKKYDQSGYAGLVAILVTVAIIAVLMVRIYLTPKEENTAEKLGVQPLTASGTAPQTEVGRMHADIDAAKAVQSQLNARNLETQREMDGI